MKYIVLETPTNNIYKNLITYCCRTCNMITLQVEIDKLEDADEQERYKYILSNLKDIPIEDVRDNWYKEEFVNKVCNYLKDANNMPWEEQLKEWKNILEDEECMKENIEKINNSIIKDYIEHMLYVTVGYNDYQRRMKQYVNKFRNNIIKIDKGIYKEGWKNYDTYYFSINNLLEQELLNRNSLFEWNFPVLPSNLCFYRNKKKWMETISHEEICRIYIDSQKEFEELKKIGVKLEEEKL